tara:strand:- start:18227 stop:19495 length:1269 start_codon:yes stop_codon:yes gene_type:complete
MKEERIAIIGLGYVGLPLAIEFGKVFQTIGFDTNKERIDELLLGKDSTREVTKEELKESTMLSYTTNINDLQDSNIYIITVPTPIDKLDNPNLGPLKNASITVGRFLKKNDLVIYESTVYPGATEEVCVPILEENSGLKFNQDFFCGYSPERINPGDKTHRLTMIKKVTSGSTEKIAEKVDNLYGSIISAGTHRAESIKIAEAAKVIENTQRDVNIALINELAKFFNKLGIDTESVLKAAGTKWNFLPFVPGLVGGHCIGVDPYYLAHKAKEIGFDPEMIASGRTINNGMGSYIAIEVAQLMSKKRINPVDANVLIMGLAFKENSPDIRNTGVARLVTTLESFNCNVHVYDPWIDKNEAKKEFNINLLDSPEKGRYDAIILAVAHDEFKKLSIEEIKAFGSSNHVLYDIKYLLDQSEVDGRL